VRPASAVSFNSAQCVYDQLCCFHQRTTLNAVIAVPPMECQSGNCAVPPLYASGTFNHRAFKQPAATSTHSQATAHLHLSRHRASRFFVDDHMKTHLSLGKCSKCAPASRAVAILTHEAFCCSNRSVRVGGYLTLRAGDAVAISSLWTNQSRQYVGKLPAADCLGHECTCSHNKMCYRA
jgi:hypothetical protein